jgi:glycosyltransferase involved in cell wall biosynthesis
MTIAYLVSHYPKVSHTFIRREILALEQLGLPIIRLAVRGWADDAPDPQDQAEMVKTRYLLQKGMPALVWASALALISSPSRWFSAFLLALRMSRRADRPWPVHLIYLAEACLALRWLREAEATHLHAHFGTNAAEVAMLVNKLGGPPYSFTVHGSEEFDKPEFLHLREKLKRASFVIAVTSYCRSQLYRWMEPPQWSKVKLVRCGLERAFYETTVAPPAGHRLVCVGRLSDPKGHLLLIEAAGLVAARGIDFELVMAGDGEQRPLIEARVAELGLKKNVRITGWITSAQVRDEIIGARALVLASFAEGLPIVLIEAMALKRPVVTTWITGIPELVRHGEHGWLFAPGDVQACADAMSACLTCPLEVLTRMGESAKIAALELHDIEKEAGKLAALFNAVNGQK